MRLARLFSSVLLVCAIGCDSPNPELDASPDGSTPDAGPQGNVCGDGVISGPEQCDDENTVGGDGCSADCLSNERCGNGVQDDGEVCDDDNVQNGDGCSADCLSDESCGNGTIDLGAGEVCDDGNALGGDGCASTCRSDESCGNDVIDEGESCDDGNLANDDGCDAGCQLESCGDGVTDVNEDCDDMNDVAGDGCEADCSFSCEDASDCAPIDACTTGACDTTTHACGAPVPVTDGTACDRDEDPSTVDLCATGVCQASYCGDGIVNAEDCDDGNDVSGDGCEPDCTFSCAADSDCDDTLFCNGVETCDLTTHACVPGTDEDDGTSCGIANTCRGGVCALNGCGDGMTEGGEQCDDMNLVEGDGCDNDCRFSCETAVDCDDGRDCNGAEECNGSNVCVAGSPPGDGAQCERDGDEDTREICRGPTCVLSTCGDAVTDAAAGEECDDGNAVNGDGCDNDCTFTCEMDAECDDGDACNGAETCDVGAHLCEPSAAMLPDGSVCEADGLSFTRDICLSASCARSACGDGYTDAELSRPEACDDGNDVDGDGCDSDCQITPTAFRFLELAIVDPHVYTPLGTTCTDITETVNTQIEAFLTGDSNSDGFYDLGLVSTFRPLDLSAASTPAELHFDALCEVGPPEVCSPRPGLDPAIAIAANMNGAADQCFAVDATTLSSSYFVAGDHEVNEPTGPCFAATADDLRINLGGIIVDLQQVTMAATYAGGSPPSTLVTGTIAGFLSETDARLALLPPGLPLVGGDTLYEHLAAGRASGSACVNTDRGDHGWAGGGTQDDTDSIDIGGTPTRGFWFYLNFRAQTSGWLPSR